jgi:hypothetical protein
MAKKCKTSQVVHNLRLIDSKAKPTFSLSDLQEVKLPEWPPASEDNPELKMNWDKAEAEAQNHLSHIFSLKMFSPYPILSYCLGEAVIHGSRLQLCYLLFPTPTPKKLTHAVAQIVFEAPLGTNGGHLEKFWMDVLREEELSEDNKIHLRLERDLQIFNKTISKRKEVRSQVRCREPYASDLPAYQVKST